MDGEKSYFGGGDLSGPLYFLGVAGVLGINYFLVAYEDWPREKSTEEKCHHFYALTLLEVIACGTNFFKNLVGGKN